VDFQFRLRISADLTAAIHCILHDVEVAARPAATSATDIPSAYRVGNDVVDTRAILAFGHWLIPFLRRDPRLVPQQVPPQMQQRYANAHRTRELTQRF
jgi:hypothetical protein